MKKIKAGLLCIPAIAGTYLTQAQTEERPNILWIVSEDNTNTFIGCYGNEYTTTPHIDRFASEGYLFRNAFCTAPMSSPSRSTLISGMYPPTIGTDNMRSEYTPPSFVWFFPRYLREAGYYTTNNVKKDYNMVDQPEAWDESSTKATYKNRRNGQPFFAVFNLMITHESGIYPPKATSALKHDPDRVILPPYHPSTPEIRHDWAYYYDNIEKMDAEVGAILHDLEKSGLAENTIVFYYSDNGGVLGRSKRYVYESGLHVPLIIRVPAKYRHLFPSYQPGSSTDRLVTFLDFAPTILSLADIPVPGYMQGTAFMGKQAGPEQEYVYGFRSRMTERFDLYRTVRNKQYRYIRNYMPHKTYDQQDEYLMQALSMQSWKDEFVHNRTDGVQSRFWKVKPAEELYDADADPDNVKNLADNREYRKILQQMRQANQEWIIHSADAGFIPEAMTFEKSRQHSAIYDYARSNRYDIKKVLRVAEAASIKTKKGHKMLAEGLKDKDPVVRYWSLLGCIIHKDVVDTPECILPLLNDTEPAVRIAASEALYTLFNEIKQVREILKQEIASDNEIIVIQALNVIDLMGKDAEILFPEIRKIYDKDPDSSDYDVRLARKILGKPSKKYPSAATPFIIPN